MKKCFFRKTPTCYWIPIAFSIITTIISCSYMQPNITGKWGGNNVVLDITKEGDNYFIESTNQGGGANGKYSGKYENGIIKIGQSVLGDITYNNERDKLYFAGSELTRISESNKNQFLTGQERAAMEKAKQDSLAAVEAAKAAESAAKAQARAEAEFMAKKKMDSIFDAASRRMK